MKITAYNRDANYDAVCAELYALDDPHCERAAQLRSQLDNMECLAPALEYRGVDAMAEALKAQHRMIGESEVES